MQDFSYRTKPMLSVADPDLEPSWGGGEGGGHKVTTISEADSLFLNV